MKAEWEYTSMESAGYDDDGYEYTVRLSAAVTVDPLRKLTDYLSSHTPGQLTRDLIKANILR